MGKRAAETAGLREEALKAIERLVHFALEHSLIDWWDMEYARNRLLELFNEDDPYTGEADAALLDSPQSLLNTLIDYGYYIGLIPENTDTYRDLLDAKIMGLVMPKPSEVIASFRSTAQDEGIEAATGRFVKLCTDANYIRMDRIASNVYWKQETPYGNMEITINLSKPEKTPEEIAAAKLLPPPAYPKCQLCRENVGYAGRINHPARQNLRVIPLTLNGEPWYFQYSPYVYYNEHSIVFRHDHVPMKLTKDTFRRLLDFVRQFPHYFIGSNADLPIVGGSILTHDHFQGGKHKFPLEKSPLDAVFHSAKYPGLTMGIVRWPMSVLRLSGADAGMLLEAGNDLYELWKGYSDPELGIFAHSEQERATVRHNTVTPIVRRSADGGYEMDIVLRNNRTDAEHPEGIFHPHREMHHIKKENIGLIEVMGLAILPGRLKKELALIARILSGDDEMRMGALAGKVPELVPHTEWIGSLLERFRTGLPKERAEALLQDEVGRKFAEILGHAGVYKRTPEGQQGLRRFAEAAGFTD
ncbi:UDP-glucose--hexose-1-phosphate uridylyltransferase [Paenibacillus caui]|uniref:UDP-glucose--hexose-1-phosphate uridylyltransferase n=1 Tax=Paenibacillus caui TaxID=2873927 RepID=UPI001F28D3F9|nr:UDP-glucose--hexose-1-phosphate uridylyltransferase [Paenibacillus caui]